jgi:hypothetical protein
MLDERQKCAHCGEHKLYAEFPKNLHRKRLIGSYCYPCDSALRKARKQKPGVREKDSENVMNWKMQQKYGITNEEARELRKQPCEICGGVTKVMHIDHSVEGSYHGILCGRCNPGIGFFDHNPELMLKALEYCRRTRK